MVPSSANGRLRAALTFPQSDNFGVALGPALVSVGPDAAEHHHRRRGVRARIPEQPASGTGAVPPGFLDAAGAPRAVGRRPGVFLTLMTILLAHELGHYFACRYYGVDASLPYFLPAPTPIGTLGAFIRIRSPIYTRRALFDIGIAGPLAGFVALVPALVIGVAFSKVIPNIAVRGDMIFGVPRILRAFEWAFFPGVRSAGYLPTSGGACRLGGYSRHRAQPDSDRATGRRPHPLFVRREVSQAALARVRRRCCCCSGLFYSPTWLVWAVILFLFALRHPTIFDVAPLDRTRVVLGLTALAIFLLTFTVVPIR